MKILWYSNVVLPQVADAAGINQKANSAGWIEGFLREIKAFDNVELGIICPYSSYLSGKNEKLSYWLVDNDTRYNEILKSFAPDIVHVFGTESVESNKLIKEFGRPERTVVNIQGMAELYGNVYLRGLPVDLCRKERLFEKYIKNGLLSQKNNLLKRGLVERDTMQRIGHVIGRTDIDRMFAITSNPDINYHFCNEILREDFYTSEKWDVQNIDRYTILFRNTSNPIKGLYGMLKAMTQILKTYPNAHLNVIGNSIHYPKTFKQRIVESSYNRLLREYVEDNGLKDHITFVGTLSPEQMKEQYLRSHCVVSASVIENESNVVSEAKILGVPVVSSFVGGLPNRITHGVDGMLYDFGMPEMLAYYVNKIFADDNLSVSISKNAIESQTVINDPKTNIKKLIDIYISML